MKQLGQKIYPPQKALSTSPFLVKIMKLCKCVPLAMGENVDCPMLSGGVRFPDWLRLARLPP